MRFWDSSALVMLIVEQPGAPDVRALLRSDSEVLMWWGSPVECVSALARLEREGALTEPAIRVALASLAKLEAGCHHVSPTEAVREVAKRILRVHPLRAADALQLSAAIVAAAGRPGELPFVTLDVNLASAASREGFPILPP